MTNETITLQDFYDRLTRHDWFYDYSDDHSVWRRGQEEHSRLQVLARTSPEHQKLFDEFKNSVFSGPAYGTEKKDWPKRPD